MTEAKGNLKLRQKVEALLFAVGNGLTVEELEKRTKSDRILIDREIKALNRGYERLGSAFFIVKEGEIYRMRLRDELMPNIENLLKTDMRDSLLMTLSVIALRRKMRESELMKARGSIAYQHVRELEKRGLVISSREGRYKFVRLSPQFYEYFDIKREELKDITEKIEEEEKLKGRSIEYTGN
ncbi:MAG: SMC-Scp complex subunit ScpB [Candidatus Parvarchaeota archaeon]|nr:SMC-Scp complex subunit ScpB [Candidatus Parvarchaeota archaeon]MCW1301885.1 SMC-Scp complex subunit ScpB [Candidatus Parvarchaeota archaeon]